MQRLGEKLDEEVMMVMMCDRVQVKLTFCMQIQQLQVTLSELDTIKPKKVECVCIGKARLDIHTRGGGLS